MTVHPSVLRLASLAAFGIVAASGADAQILYNFSDGTANPTGSIGTVTAGVLSQGNNSGTTSLVTSTAPSTGYAGASGTFNAGASTRIAPLIPNLSTFFEFTLTPGSESGVQFNQIRFGSLSTSSGGPQRITLRSSLDSFSSDIVSFAVSANSAWALQSSSVAVSGAVNTPVTFRLYGHNGTGTQTANVANWRIDDLTLAQVPEPGSLALLALGAASFVVRRRRK